VRGTRGRGPPTALRSHRLCGAGSETVPEIESVPVENVAVHLRGTVGTDAAVPEIVAVTSPGEREMIVGGSAG
jgi:hypothetical protein